MNFARLLGVALPPMRASRTRPPTARRLRDRSLLLCGGKPAPRCAIPWTEPEPARGRWYPSSMSHVVNVRAGLEPGYCGLGVGPGFICNNFSKLRNLITHVHKCLSLPYPHHHPLPTTSDPLRETCLHQGAEYYFL